MPRDRDPDEPRIYFLPNLMTACNMACGFFAVLMIFQGLLVVGSEKVAEKDYYELVKHYYEYAILLIFGSCLFDLLDGRLARLGGQESPFGREFDSLADIISFGVAPAALAFAAGLSGGWDCVVLIYFVCCGVSRLARYNVTAEDLSAGANKVAYFEGAPIPTSVALVAILALAAWNGAIGPALWGGVLGTGALALHPLSLLFVLSGSLMVSKTLHIPKL